MDSMYDTIPQNNNHYVEYYLSVIALFKAKQETIFLVL